MNISQFSQDHTDKPFHSSGYARISRGDMMGSTNAQPFSRRVNIERGRSSIGGYRASMVGQGYVRRDVGTSPARTGLDRPVMSIRPRQRQAFREPPTRYDPYG